MNGVKPKILRQEPNSIETVIIPLGPTRIRTLRSWQA